jgi:hypothetical protein
MEQIAFTVGGCFVRHKMRTGPRSSFLDVLARILDFYRTQIFDIPLRYPQNNAAIKLYYLIDVITGLLAN